MTPTTLHSEEPTQMIRAAAPVTLEDIPSEVLRGELAARELDAGPRAIHATMIAAHKAENISWGTLSERVRNIYRAAFEAAQKAVAPDAGECHDTVPSVAAAAPQGDQ
jgi:hypothetical protein